MPIPKDVLTVNKLVNTVDDFDDGDMSEWSTDDSSAWSQQTTTVQAGSHAIEWVSGNGGTDSIFSSSGLDNYPSRGDIHRIWVRRDGTNADKLRIIFASQSSSITYWPNCYAVEYGGTELTLKKDMATTTSDSTAMTPPTGEWDYIDMDFDSGGTGDITAELFDGDDDTSIASVSINDTAYDSGNLQVSWAAGTTDTAYIDTWTITN